MPHEKSFAIVTPLANEACYFELFVSQLKIALDALKCGYVYFIVDNASKDNTLSLCHALSEKDPRFITIFAPENKNVVDAYVRGFQEAYNAGHEFMIEMDAGLSHDPKQLPRFIECLLSGYECVWGSRNISNGSNKESPFTRRFLSHIGTLLANILLGTRLKDMTSGFQGFQRHVVSQFIQYKLRSTAHFYQTELRYLLRHYKQIEIPITYRSPSKSVHIKSIINALQTLLFYTWKRFSFQEVRL